MLHVKVTTHSKCTVHIMFWYIWYQVNFVDLFVVFVDATQDLNQTLQTPLSFLFEPNVQAEYYQIEAEGLQLSPSFGQVSTPPILNLGPQTYLSLSQIAQSPSFKAQEILQFHPVIVADMCQSTA